MCASLHTTALAALTLIASSALATAAEVRVLTVGSTQVAAKALGLAIPQTLSLPRTK